MSLFEFPELAIAQLALLIVSTIWFLRRNDEIPLLISSFLLYVTSYRYWVVTKGINSWVNLGIQISITEEEAIKALACVIFGQICLLGTYMLRQNRILPIATPPKGNRRFWQWLRPKAILLGLCCLPLVLLTRSSIIAQLSGGQSLAFQVSGYLFLFPMVLVGIAALTIWLWKFGGLPKLWHKAAAIFIFFGVLNLTFGPVSRFQFLGWVVASGIILSSSYRPKTRLIILALFSVIGISLFSLAGAMRNPELASDVVNQATWFRAIGAEDGNMLDGFVILRKIYPDRLDFRWGMEHLEVLIRPIPRAWWADKPVGGGYLAYLGLSDPTKGTTLGISPTLFGSFYAEVGLFGILILSLLYGGILATIVRYSAKLQPFAGVLIRAIVCASLVPLLRGGDLAGVYAWIGMAFWPCFLLLWTKRKEFRLQLPGVFYRNPTLRHPPVPPMGQ